MGWKALRLVRFVAVLALAGPAVAQCATFEAGWEFHWRGTDYFICSSAMYDDGSGPALFVAGSFSLAGTTPALYLAKWNGTEWSAISGAPNSTMESLVVHDDGTGPALYVGGQFTAIGGVNAARIARWNGSSWSAIGGGLPMNPRTLITYDLGGGQRLYAAGGQATGPVQCWDGASWSSVGGNILGFVNSLVGHDDGGGPALFASGSFWSGTPTYGGQVARWNGTSWSAIASGGAGVLATFDDGQGDVLYAGGLSMCSAIPASCLARWDGSSWSSVGLGTDSYIESMRAWDDGAGEALYVGGRFTTAGGMAASSIARWNGTTWSPLGAGIGTGSGRSVLGLSEFDSVQGPRLLACGSFGTAGGLGADNVATWDGTTWSPLGPPTGDGASGSVYALHEYQGALYAGGPFARVGETWARSIARWNGTDWSALGTGITGTVQVLATFDPGSGPLLLAGGSFYDAGGQSAHNVAVWNGTAWSLFAGGGTNADVNALLPVQEPSGPAVYVGGAFNTSGPIASHGIARWNGTSWSALGTGIGGEVYALARYGNELCVAGTFTTPANYVARWNGSAWSSFGTGMNNHVLALAVYDAGNGPELYAGGAFTTAGGQSASRIARWNGSAWSSVGGGVDQLVTSLSVFDDGSGPALYVGGDFSTAGGNVATFFARWNGTSWSAPGGATDGTVHAMASFDDGSGHGADLWLGGRFLNAGGVPSARIAKYEGCASTGTPFCAGDTPSACPCGNAGASGHGCANGADPGGALLTASGDASLSLDTLQLACSGMPATATSRYFQGTDAQSAPFGDGVLCVGGSIVRLGTSTNSAGASQYPDTGDPPVSARGGVTVPGSVRHYQVWYRNASSFCTPATFNLSNGFSVVWR